MIEGYTQGYLEYAFLWYVLSDGVTIPGPKDQFAVIP